MIQLIRSPSKVPTYLVKHCKHCCWRVGKLCFPKFKKENSSSAFLLLIHIHPTNQRNSWYSLGIETFNYGIVVFSYTSSFDLLLLLKEKVCSSLCLKPRVAHMKSFLETILGLIFSLFSWFQYSLILNKVLRWLDSNRRSLVLEATALPTEPQPLPSPMTSCFEVCLRLLGYSATLSNGHSLPT